jgi:hypothetical protein
MQLQDFSESDVKGVGHREGSSVARGSNQKREYRTKMQLPIDWSSRGRITVVK